MSSKKVGSEFLREHNWLTRRYFLQVCAASSAMSVVGAVNAADTPAPTAPKKAKPDKAGAMLDPYFTPADDFRDVSRGKPIPHTLPEEKKKEVGLTRETWKLEVLSDPQGPSKIGKPLSKTDGTALDFNALIDLAQTHAVRFAKTMTCLNLGCPLGTGIWEGVPLREIVWLTKPREDLRRLFYYGFHNEEPSQQFRSSLPIGRVLEDPYDLPPVILCYKLNGEWLDAERGGPVRIVVPEAYGFKSVKWLSHVILTNQPHSNDTYADGNNDIDSPMKSYAATLHVPGEVKAGEPIAVSGYAQVGIAGVKKVQVALISDATERPKNDPHMTQLPWHDAEILAAPKHWGAIRDGVVPANTMGFSENGQPNTWPIRLTKIHWAAMIPPCTPGEYTLHCRTIDEKGIAQPMPRPFRKSGHAAIESVPIKVIG